MELVQIVKISISFNQLVFPMIFMKFNRFSHPMAFALVYDIPMQFWIEKSLLLLVFLSVRIR